MIIEGEKIILTATFSDDSGSLTDPQTPVTVDIKAPDSTITSATATKVAVGVFEHEYTTSQAGIYYYKFETPDGAIEQNKFNAHVDRVEL